MYTIEEKQITDAVIEFTKKDLNAGLELVTGLFVSLTTLAVDLSGEDPSKKIVIESGEKRGVTIHAIKK